MVALRRAPAKPDDPPKPIRVMFAIGGLGQGGSEKQLTELVVRLPTERFEPVVVTNRDDRFTDNGRRMTAAGIQILALGQGHGGLVRRWGRAARVYIGVLRALRPDVVYAWLDETAASLAPLSRALGIPCLIARRNTTGSVREQRHLLISQLARRAERRALLVTANSCAVARDSVARGHHPDCVRVVRNGHDELPPLPAPAGDEVTIGYVAQFRHDKGHQRLLDVLERLPRGNWRVDLAGDGPLRDACEERVNRAGLGEQVRILGAVTDVREFWRDRHLALLLSDSEGSPNALLEAAFAGRPAIATGSGGTPEVVDGGGILVPPDDPNAAAQAIRRLVSDPAERARLGQLGWQHVSRRYAMSTMVDGHIRAMEETLALARVARHRA